MNKNHFSWLIVAIISLCFLALSGCSSLKVTSLDQNAKPLTIDQRVKAKAGIERNQPGKNDQSPEVNEWANAFPEVLKKEGVFSEIIYPYKRNDVVDLVVHSTTTGKFRTEALLIFLLGGLDLLFLRKLGEERSLFTIYLLM